MFAKPKNVYWAHLLEEGVAEKGTKTDKIDTELDTCTEAGGEAGTSQSYS